MRGDPLAILEVVGLWAVSLAIGESSRIASAPARNRRHVARIVFVSQAARNPRVCSDCERAGSSRGRHQSSHWIIVSGAAHSPRRCRIASVRAHNRREMLRLRGVLLTILRLLGLSEAALILAFPSTKKKVHPVCHARGPRLRGYVAGRLPPCAG